MQVVGVDVVDRGSGYLFDNPPKITLELPPDPDWFNTPKTFYKTKDLNEDQLIFASVTQMGIGSSDVFVDTRDVRKRVDD